MSVHEHRRKAPDYVEVMVITVSDTRTKENDKSGRLIIDALQKAGHSIIKYEIVKDNAALIREAIRSGVSHSSIDLILLNGGTGIAKRDVTVEVVSEVIQKEIPGFGELFRMVSYLEDIGSAAMLSRAIAGVYKDTAIFSIPGSSGAVSLAMQKLILPEMMHVVREVKKDLE